MRNYIKEAVNATRKADSILAESFAEDVIQRGQALDEAIDDGWYVPFLRTAEVAGVGLATIGYASNSPGLTGFGLGITGMAGLQDIIISRSLRRDRNRDKNRESI